MIGPLGCCGQKTKKTLQGTRLNLEQKYQKIWRFNDEELFEFTKRFESQAVNHKLSHKNYRDSLGIIGIESLSFLCDRMFTVMDKDKDGFITIDEYLNYIDVLLYGAEEEKLKQSFELLDDQNKNFITFHEFRRIVSSFAQMWSAALGQPTPINPRWIDKIFHTLAQEKDFFDFNDFMREMRNNPDLLFWFSKPEKAMNKRLNEHLGKQELKEQIIQEKIEGMKEKMTLYQDHIQQKLQQCVEVLSGMITPKHSQVGSILGSPREVGQEENLKSIKTWQIPKNQLFMNLNPQVPLQNIEFPTSSGFESINLSPRSNLKRIQKIYKRIGNKRGKSGMRGSIGPYTAERGLGFDIIVEEENKPITEEEKLNDLEKNKFLNLRNMIKDYDKVQNKILSKTVEERRKPSIVLHRIDKFERNDGIKFIQSDTSDNVEQNLYLDEENKEEQTESIFERDMIYKFNNNEDDMNLEGGEKDYS